MDIRQFAKPYQWRGVTLYYTPYRRLPVEMAIRALNEIEPENEWVNAKTGERVIGDEPDALTKAKDKAAKMNIAVSSPWQRHRLWTLLHDTFYLCLPSIVAVDFPEFDEQTPLELRAFAAYWNDPGKTFAERWANFNLVIGTETTNALWNGYTETRENLAPAKPELVGELSDDPKKGRSKSKNVSATSDS